MIFFKTNVKKYNNNKIYKQYDQNVKKKIKDMNKLIKIKIIINCTNGQILNFDKVPIYYKIKIKN